MKSMDGVGQLTLKGKTRACHGLCALKPMSLSPAINAELQQGYLAGHLAPPSKSLACLTAN